MAWHRFASLVETCPVLGLPNLVLLQHFWVGLLEDSAMRLDALSGGTFVFLEPERGKEIMGEIRDFNSLPVSGSEVAERDDVELPRSIFERARAYTPIFTSLWSKVSILISRNLWERAPSVSSAFRFPYHLFS
jgi:hypothetical protein